MREIYTPIFLFIMNETDNYVDDSLTMYDSVEEAESSYEVNDVPGPRGSLNSALRGYDAFGRLLNVGLVKKRGEIPVPLHSEVDDRHYKIKITLSEDETQHTEELIERIKESFLRRCDIEVQFSCLEDVYSDMIFLYNIAKW